MPEGVSGVMVVKTDPLSAAHGAIQKNDVALEVDGVPIADDGETLEPMGSGAFWW